MTTTLYVGSKRYSSWSLRPYLALAHAGVTFDCVTITLDVPGYKDAIKQVNAAGRVPVLYHDELVVWDSLAICEYVAELVPQAKLWPEDRAARAVARSISAEMHSSFAALRRDMWMDLGVHKAGVTYGDDTKADVARITGLWRERLAISKGPFLFGGFTIADAMFAPVATRFVTYDVDLDAPCRAYVEAVHALPAMREWHADAAREPVSRMGNAPRPI
jgi:glutathione S-transferase